MCCEDMLNRKEHIGEIFPQECALPPLKSCFLCRSSNHRPERGFRCYMCEDLGDGITHSDESGSLSEVNDSVRVGVEKFFSSELTESGYRGRRRSIVARVMAD